MICMKIEFPVDKIGVFLRGDVIPHKIHPRNTKYEGTIVYGIPGRKRGFPLSEKSILAYFKAPEDAEGVSRKLQALRVTELSIDRFSRFGGNGLQAGVNPVTGNLASMDSMTSGSAFTGILAAAHTSGSGMSHGGDGGPTGRNILLTAIVDPGIYDQAVTIIEEAGGMI